MLMCEKYLHLRRNDDRDQGLMGTPKPLNVWLGVFIYWPPWCFYILGPVLNKKKI